MEIRQLRYFLAVANARSFLQAADSLYVSRQAVSKAITQLEDELQVPLFVRTQNGAMMTPAGIYFYPRATALTADFDRLKEDMLEVDRTYRSRLRFYMAHGIYDMYAQLLHNYSIAHWSEMDLQLHSCLDADCAMVLADRRADAVLSFSPIRDSSLESVPILETPVSILMHPDHPLADRDELSIAELSAFPALLYTGGHSSCPWWPGPRLRHNIGCDDFSSLFSLLKGNMGFLPLPEAMIPEYVDFALVKSCPEITTPCRVYYSALHPAHYDSLTYNLLGAMEKDIFGI